MIFIIQKTEQISTVQRKMKNPVAATDPVFDLLMTSYDL